MSFAFLEINSSFYQSSNASENTETEEVPPPPPPPPQPKHGDELTDERWGYSAGATPEKFKKVYYGNVKSGSVAVDQGDMKLRYGYYNYSRNNNAWNAVVFNKKGGTIKVKIYKSKITGGSLNILGISGKKELNISGGRSLHLESMVHPGYLTDDGAYKLLVAANKLIAEPLVGSEYKIKINGTNDEIECVQDEDSIYFNIVIEHLSSRHIKLSVGTDNKLDELASYGLDADCKHEILVFGATSDAVYLDLSGLDFNGL